MALDTVGVKYEADVTNLQKGLDDAIKKTTTLKQEAEKTGETLEDSFLKGSDGAKRFDAEMKKQPKTVAELELRLQRLRELLRDDTKIGTEGFKQVSAAIKATEKEVQELNKTSSTLKEKLSEVPGPVGKIMSGISGVSKALKLLIANPIVLLVSALVAGLTTLYSWFQKTDSGATQTAAVFSAVSTAASTLFKNLGNIASAMGAFVTGNFREASQIISGVASNMRNAAVAAYEYELALDALKEAELRYTTDMAKNAQKIAELRFMSEDRSIGITERREALREAIELGEQELRQRQELAKQGLDLKIAQRAAEFDVDKEILKEYVSAGRENAEALLRIYPQLKKAREGLKDEGEKELRDMYNNILNLETDFFNKNKENMNRMNAFNETARKEELERVRRANEKRLADETKRINDEFTLQQLRINVMQDGIGKEIAARDLAYERERFQFKDNKEALLLIEQKYWQDIESIRKKYRDQDLGEQEVVDEEVVKQEERAQEVIKQLLDERIKTLLTGQEYEQRQLKQHYDNLRAEVGDNEEALALINEDYERKKAEVDDKYRAEEQAKNQAALEGNIQTAQATYDGINAIGEMLIQDEAQRAEFMKAMTLFKLGLSTTEAISKATASAAGLPFPTNIPAIATAVGTVLANIAAAKQAFQGAQAPAFKDGVIDLQGPGTGTSDSIPAWLSKGESVMTNKETRTFKDELKAMRAGNYADLITQKYVLPVLRAQASDTAQRMATGLKLQASLDDDRIVSQLGRIKPATAKDIERLGSTLARQWKDTAYRNSKSWKA